MTYTQPKETSWVMRLEELEKACSRELAACLLGLKATQTDAVSERMKQLRLEIPISVALGVKPSDLQP